MYMEQMTVSRTGGAVTQWVVAAASCFVFCVNTEDPLGPYHTDYDGSATVAIDHGKYWNYSRAVVAWMIGGSWEIVWNTD